MKAFVTVVVILMACCVYAAVEVQRAADAREASRAAACPAGTVYSSHLTMCVLGSRPWLSKGEKR